MLDYYLTETRQLLQNPSAPTSLYDDTDLTDYINRARVQVAGEARCCRVLGTISTVIGQRSYVFTDIDTSSQQGIGTVAHIRSIRYGVGTGSKWVTPRSWPWFDLYYLNNPVPPSGAPKRWSVFGQGGGSFNGISSGSFYLDPLPDIAYNLICDCVCFPVPLGDDTTFEAVPNIFIEAVCFYAAYLALLSSQTTARRADAQNFLDYYTQFVERARNAATPDVLRYEYEQVPDPTALNQMGLPQGKGQQQ